MYAVFQTGGKQYRAVPGAVVRIEKMEWAEGQTLQWPALCVKDSGVTQGVVKAEPLGIFKEDKVIVFKKTRRHTYRRKNGHRQQLLWVRITEVA